MGLTRNACPGFLELPCDRRDKPGSPAATGQRRRQKGQGAERSSLPLELLPGRGDRRGRSWAPEIRPGRCSGSEGLRSAHPRRPRGCSSELQAKFSAVPVGAGQGLRVVAVLPEHEPRPRRGGGGDGGPGSQASSPGSSAPPAGVLVRFRPTHRPLAERRLTRGRGSRRAAPPSRTSRQCLDLPPEELLAGLASRAPAPARASQATAEVAPLT